MLRIILYSEISCGKMSIGCMNYEKCSFIPSNLISRSAKYLTQQSVFALFLFNPIFRSKSYQGQHSSRSKWVTAFRGVRGKPESIRYDKSQEEMFTNDFYQTCPILFLFLSLLSYYSTQDIDEDKELHPLGW